jgi:hypothetical protein
MRVWAVGAWAAGLGRRAVARGVAIDPGTVLAWLLEGAEHATAFSQHCRHEVRATQVPLDDLSALVRAVTTAAVGEAAAGQRLSRPPTGYGRRWLR